MNNPIPTPNPSIPSPDEPEATQNSAPETTVQNQLANGATDDPGLLSPAKALALFQQDPVAFIRAVVDNAAETHLAGLKEQAELHGAIAAFRKAHPEFQRFESFILQEASNLLHGDNPATGPWSTILEKAMENFKEKLTRTIQENQPATMTNAQNPPYMESAGNRIPTELPATFTRAQIAGMSMQDFLKNEAAINDALKNNRIQ